jgi:ATP-binding cassette, subfamily F, member 3
MVNKEILPEAKKDNNMRARFDHVGFVTYDHVLFKDLSITIESGEIIALTGKSGTGKTVIIKILAGLEQPHEGNLSIVPSTTISYVPQELEDIEVDSGTTIRTLLKDARGLNKIESRMSELESKIAIDLNPNNDSIIEYGKLAEKYQSLNGYDPEPEMQKILAGLGVDEHSTGNVTLETQLSEVSSGQLKRILIARALFAKPDILLLDDPTSHLDVAAVQWLVDYLKDIRSAVVIATNNSTFLDKCATKTLGLTDVGRLFIFEGGYSDFIAKKEAVVDAERAQASTVEDKLQQLKDTDKMFRSKQVYKRSANMAQVGRALATRMNKLENKYKEMPGSQVIYDQTKIKDMSFEMETISGKDVISINKIIKRYGNYTAVDLSHCNPINLSRGEQWLIRGPNGSGKSTLLRMIIETIIGGKFIPDEGKIEIGTNVTSAYYTPDLLNISASGSILSEVTDKIGVLDSRKAASVLSYFGFTPSAALNLNVNMLSSGEKKRLALAKIMLGNYNFLILDEPTGDYMPNDIKERLARALVGYQGTVLLASHDSYFLDRLRIDFKINMPEGKVT